jgi:transglutaminase-like putative cysteine protease
MTFKVSGLPPGVEPPSDAIQEQLSEGTYRITVPADVSAVAAEPLDDPVQYLSGDALVQVGHPNIEAAVKDILNGDEDSWALAMHLYSWVYENIDKKIVLSFPSALEVLESREGDCNEHTVLYTALARTAKLPTRIAIGVVWSEALGGFYYHAWPEVYVGGWVPVDPTLGQPIADATHIKLLNGNIESWPRLVPYLGQLQVEITDIE